jgi:expansin (peptidoglycan-binding protein)
MRYPLFQIDMTRDEKWVQIKMMAQESLQSCHLRRRQLSLTDSHDAHSD